jgi:uncharacterized membrane protein
MRLRKNSAIIISVSLFVAAFYILPASALPYPDYPSFISCFKALATSYPQFVSYESIGKTVLDQDILLFKIGNPMGGVVLFDGAIHGWESEGSQLLYYYASWLLTSSDPLAVQILTTTCTLLVPVVNVDDYSNNRTNAHGVDLNRNFVTDWQHGGGSDPTSDYYRGPSPLSEPESQSLARVFQTRKPRFYVNIHDGGGEIIYPSTYTDSAYRASVFDKINSLSSQRGVATYSSMVVGGEGYAIADAAKAGARLSFMLELGNGTRTLSEVSTSVLPRFIPIAAVLSQECGSGVLFTDSFESGDFRSWDGTQTTSGGTLSITNTLARQGTQSGLFTADGGQSPETAYCYKNLQDSTSMFARGYFTVTSFIDTASYSRFYFAAFAASGNKVAMAGCRKSGGTTWWRLAVVNDSSWVIVDSEVSNLLKQWYRFELQWSQSPTNGYGKLYVDNKLVCSILGINTTTYGAVDSAEFGIAQSGNAKTAFCLDYVQVSRVSLGPLPIPADLNLDGKVDVYDMIIFSKAFGSVPGSPRWNPVADLDADGIVDIRDALLVAQHYGQQQT